MTAPSATTPCANTSEAIASILAARSGDDLFGPRPPADADADLAARGAYRCLARLVHPDHAPDAAQAAAAFARLSVLWREREHGRGDDRGRAVIEGRLHAYVLGEHLATGDLATLFRVRFREADADHDGVLKLVRSPANCDLGEAEGRALRALARGVDPRFRAFLPELVEAFRLRDAATGAIRSAVVTRALVPGFVSLAQVGAAYPDGLDARDGAWMWRRLLVALGAAHGAGVVHGAVTPEHVLVHPALHGLVLIDWCYSSLAPFGPLTAIVPSRRALYPPEILARGPASPSGDIFMATRVMASLLDAAAPRALRRFAAGCTLAGPAARPSDAFALLAELDDHLDRLWPRAFRPFSMPPNTGADAPRPDGADLPRHA
jgi:hypothetical protein